jgi:phosphate transport system permease protein
LILGPTCLVSIITTIIIVVILFEESWAFFRQVSVWDFLTGTQWNPLIGEKTFGVLPLVTGTLMITIGASLVALPLGLLCAIYLSVFAGNRVRQIVKPLLEILAGIPTIVYGHFALTFVTPLFKTIFPSMEIFNALSGAIVVGIMILPMVASLCDDAFTAVPKGLREGAFAVGATSLEVVFGVLIPMTLSRIMASFILAISRAIGETMAVTLASGANPIMAVNPLHSIQTMTAYIVQVSMGDVPAGGIEYLTCFAVALLLFLITLVLNLTGIILLQRYRQWERV